MTQPNPIIDAINNATESDLEAVETRMAELTAELESLKVVHKALHTRIHGKKQAASQPQKKITLDDIYDVITQHGPGTAREIGLKLGVTGNKVGIMCSKSDWFERDEDNKITIARK